jgi:Flp pilus assembly pilin Flp
MRDESGQDLIEYGVLGALIAAAAVTVLTDLSTEINRLYQFVIDRI